MGLHIVSRTRGQAGCSPAERPEEEEGPSAEALGRSQQPGPQMSVLIQLATTLRPGGECGVGVEKGGWELEDGTGVCEVGIGVVMSFWTQCPFPEVCDSWTGSW